MGIRCRLFSLKRANYSMSIGTKTVNKLVPGDMPSHATSARIKEINGKLTSVRESMVLRAQGGSPMLGESVNGLIGIAQSAIVDSGLKPGEKADVVIGCARSLEALGEYRRHHVVMDKVNMAVAILRDGVSKSPQLQANEEVKAALDAAKVSVLTSTRARGTLPALTGQHREWIAIKRTYDDYCEERGKPHDVRHVFEVTAYIEGEIGLIRGTGNKKSLRELILKDIREG